MKTTEEYSFSPLCHDSKHYLTIHPAIYGLSLKKTFVNLISGVTVLRLPSLTTPSPKGKADSLPYL